MNQPQAVKPSPPEPRLGIFLCECGDRIVPQVDPAVLAQLLAGAARRRSTWKPCRFPVSAPGWTGSRRWWPQRAQPAHRGRLRKPHPAQKIRAGPGGPGAGGRPRSTWSTSGTMWPRSIGRAPPNWPKGGQAHPGLPGLARDPEAGSPDPHRLSGAGHGAGRGRRRPTARPRNWPDRGWKPSCPQLRPGGGNAAAPAQLYLGDYHSYDRLERIIQEVEASPLVNQTRVGSSATGLRQVRRLHRDLRLSGGRGPLGLQSRGHHRRPGLGAWRINFRSSAMMGSAGYLPGRDERIHPGRAAPEGRVVFWINDLEAGQPFAAHAFHEKRLEYGHPSAGKFPRDPGVDPL